MEFRELKTFQVVASLLSFNQAANILHLAQSTVSAQIRSLENSLGKELFHRSGRTISLSPAGVKLLNYTQRLVNIEKEILSSFGNLEEKYGTLIIKTPQSVSSYFLPELIKEFQIIFPKIGFDIDWCTSYNLLDLLNSGTIDLAFLITDSFKDKDLQIEELTDIKLVLAVHPDDHLAKNKTIRIEDLDHQNFIFVKSDCSYSNILMNLLLNAHVEPNKIIEINSLQAVKDLVVLGNGIALIPEFVIQDEIKEGLMKKIELNNADLTAKLFMIWSKEKHVSKPLEAFMMMVKKLIELL